MEICFSTSMLENLPKLIDIKGHSYILSKDDDNYPVLFNATCPHQHNIVNDLNTTVLRCPSHDWKFESTTGQCINAPQSCLSKIPLRIEGNLLYAILPDEKENKIQMLKGEKIFPKITVVGSASLLIEWNGFNILTDPWIEGTAVFDSWINYPPSEIKVTDLPKIDAIWISHEHTDHFNEYTLSLFDKSIPVYVPEFDNGRMKQLVEKIGFKNVTSMPHGKLFSLANNINAISFASGSFWNDNILYLQLGSFTILNVNDAGFNWTIPNIVGKVNMICSQFSPASGYPATWTHIDDEKKLSLMKDRNLGILNMMKQIITLCNADYILPFANFNELYQNNHRKYVKMQPKNRLDDVINFFKSSDVEVIDLLPGESWDGKQKKFFRRINRNDYFKKEYMFNYLTQKFESAEKNKKIIKFDLTHKEIKNYFESFANSKLTKEIGEYSICLTLEHKKTSMFSLIKFKEGKVKYESSDHMFDANMTMQCPGIIIQDIIRNDLSWDEVSSGYWGKFTRNPDTYNVSLWRLFHAPWKARTNYLNHEESLDIKTSSIADIIEKFGKPALNIFEKYGLYCAGCEAAMGEKIIDGCKFHGLSSQQTHNLIEEISRIVKNKNL